MSTLVAGPVPVTPLDDDPTDEAGEPVPPMPRAWWVASLIGGALATVLFAYVLFIGKTELTAAPTGNFYDLQTRAWFDGQWDIPKVPVPGEYYSPPARTPALVRVEDQTYSPLSIEAIVIDGRDYLYYGPVPSVLRVPVLLGTDDLDGKLTQPFMLVAFGVALVALTRLHWRIRWMVKPEPELTDREPLLAGVVTFGLGGGSVLLYLGSQPTVYHEAMLWGVAFALLAYSAVLDVQASPSVRAVTWAGAWTVLAVLSRASVGVGPLVALGLLLLVFAWRWFRIRTPPSADTQVTRRVALALLVACVVPVLAYAGVNQVKFGEPLRLPLEKQIFSQLDAQRIAALDDNDGSLFGLKFAPSTALQYMRPDAIEVDSLAPWLNFPREQATVVGDVTFDTRDETSSVPATMPVWTVLAAIGAVALARDLIRREGRMRSMLVPVAGAVAGCAGVITIAFIAHRYLGDFFPLIALLSLAGVQVSARWWGRAPRAQRAVAGVALGLLALWSIAANLALAIEYQRLVAPVDESTRTAFVEWQYTNPRSPGTLPRVSYRLLAVEGERGVIGAICTGGMDTCEVWWSDGFEWSLLAEGSHDEIEQRFDSDLVPVSDG